MPSFPRTDFLIDQAYELATRLPGASRVSAEAVGVGALGALLGEIIEAEAGNPAWTLEPDGVPFVEQVDGRVYGRGAPDRFSSTSGLSIATGGGFLTGAPATTPTGAQPRGWELEATFVSEHDDDDLTVIDRKLQEFQKRAAGQRRFPRLRLKYGTAAVDEAVWLASYAAEYGAPWLTSGLPTRLTIRLSLTAIRDHAFTQASLKPRETSYHTLGSGETFEFLAGLYYGDPGFSVLLRRINPEILLETPGLTVKLLDREHPLMRRGRGPLAPPLVENFAADLNAFARARLGRDPGQTWAALARWREPDANEPLLFPEG